MYFLVPKTKNQKSNSNIYKRYSFTCLCYLWPASQRFKCMYLFEDVLRSTADKLGRLLKQCICTKFFTVPCSVHKLGMITSLEFGQKHFFSKFIANRYNEKLKLRFSSCHRSLHQKMLRRDSWTHNTIIIIQCRLFLLDSTEIQFLRSCKRQSGMILAIIISF